MPEILAAFQRSVQAACVGYHVAQDWTDVGVTKPALVDKWPVYDVSPDGECFLLLYILS